MIRRPFWYGFGGKWRHGLDYPAPLYPVIVEPFAGAAGYSMRYHDRNVILIERDPIIAATWRYLINVSEEEIRRLPLIGDDQTVDDLRVCQEARWLIGWWLNRSAAPRKMPSKWMRSGLNQTSFGGPAVREMIASQLHMIRHWQIIEGDYHDAPGIEATWFIDPPYFGRPGSNYRYGSSKIDYAELADWCLSRRGQVIVCEQDGANWLPFEPWRRVRATQHGREARWSEEAIWYRANGPMMDGAQYRLDV